MAGAHSRAGKGGTMAAKASVKLSQSRIADIYVARKQAHERGVRVNVARSAREPVAFGVRAAAMRQNEGNYPARDRAARVFHKNRRAAEAADLKSRLGG